MLQHTDMATDRYAEQIGRVKLLSPKQEQELARRYRDHGDEQAGEQLVLANLRFVLKIAHEYRGYALPLLDLVQEGNIGLMKAVEKYDPDRGYRLISYAVWWIRAYMQNFIIRSWSLVKLGTTQAQRKLFFKLRSERELADRLAGPGATASAAQLSKRLAVAESDVANMELRLAARDLSLDTRVREGERPTHLEQLPDLGSNQEEMVGTAEQRAVVREKLGEAMALLNERERYIVKKRLMSDEPETLQAVGKHFSISRERARQIEVMATRKVREQLVAGGLELAPA